MPFDRAAFASGFMDNPVSASIAMFSRRWTSCTQNELPYSLRCALSDAEPLVRPEVAGSHFYALLIQLGLSENWRLHVVVARQRRAWLLSRSSRACLTVAHCRYLFTIGLVGEFGSKKICDKVLAHEIKDCSRLPY